MKLMKSKPKKKRLSSDIHVEALNSSADEGVREFKLVSEDSQVQCL